MTAPEERPENLGQFGFGDAGPFIVDRYVFRLCFEAGIFNDVRHMRKIILLVSLLPALAFANPPGTDHFDCGEFGRPRFHHFKHGGEHLRSILHNIDLSDEQHKNIALHRARIGHEIFNRLTPLQRDKLKAKLDNDD